MMAAAVSVQAQSDTTDDKDDCQGCHEIIEAHWQESGHAKAITNTVFQQAWQEQGQPSECLACHTTGYDVETGTYEADSITCTVCHNPLPGNHPEEIMPTDISSRLCGECHLDTYAEWELSTHGQENLACVRCHSPHTTGLRANGIQELCQSCHNNEAHFYSFTGHADEGLLCADCHLRVTDVQMGDGHGQRMHTFAVDLETCAKCHGESMHYPTVAAASVGSNLATADTAVPLEMPPLHQTPDPVSPYGFAIIAALIGMGFGIILAPWLENWYRRSK
jgi:formate-dependent nitrite reductase cytochrome c552 subunit